MSDAIDDLFRGTAAGSPSLGDVQRHRLLQLMRRYHGRVVWDGVGAVSAPSTAVIVLNSATAPRLETLIGSLHENSIVIIPFGENPAFDVLKAKLHAYGSIGSEGKSAPHHVWWGGVKPLAIPTGMYRKQDTRFVSSFRPASVSQAKAVRLMASLKELDLDYAIEQSSPEISVDATGLSTVDLIIRHWEQSQRPIFYVAPEAELRKLPLLPQALGCDFAIHKRRSGELETGAMFFHQTEPARSLLEIWQRLSHSYPDLPEAFLLDQAWTLASSQRQLETAWLPDSYWQLSGAPGWDRDATIVCQQPNPKREPQDALALRFQNARRFGRHQAPEPHLIMRGESPTRGHITVVIRDVLSADAQNVGAAVEAVAHAFAANPGGFSQMEVVLGAWEDDVDSVLEIEDDSWVLLTDPSERLELNAFGLLGNGGASPRQNSSAGALNDADGERPAIFSLADPSLGARLKRSGQRQAAFFKRPLPAEI